MGLLAPYQLTRTLEGSVQDELFLLVLRQLGLLPVWEFVRDHNPTGQILPYHNNYHLFQVARIANDLLFFHGSKEQRSLITAALFHDFNHSGGERSDKVNIERALQGFDAFIQKQVLIDLELPTVAQTDIQALIRSTEYPAETEPTSLLAKCLRDADLLFSLADDSVPVVMNGLRQEMGVATGNLLSLDEMVEHQKRFFATVKMYTPVGKLLWDQLHQDTLARQLQYSRKELAWILRSS